MRIIAIIILLILLKPAPAQTFQWKQDSTGQWFINEAFFNDFKDTASDMQGNRIFFTAHQPDEYWKDKGASHLLVNRFDAAGNPQVIKRLNFFSEYFILKKFNGHYFFLVTESNFRGSKVHNTVLEYDTAWNYVRHVYIQIKMNDYVDFVPSESGGFFLISGPDTDPGGFPLSSAVVKANSKGKIETYKIIKNAELQNLTIQGDTLRCDAWFDQRYARTGKPDDSLKHVVMDTLLQYTIIPDTAIYRPNHYLVFCPSGESAYNKWDDGNDAVFFRDKNNEQIARYGVLPEQDLRTIGALNHGRYVMFIEVENEAGFDTTQMILIDDSLHQTKLKSWVSDYEAKVLLWDYEVIYTDDRHYALFYTKEIYGERKKILMLEQITMNE